MDPAQPPQPGYIVNPTTAPEPWAMVLDSLRRIESRLDNFVSIQAHTADMRRIDARVNDIAADLGMERAARAEDRAEVIASIEALRAALETEAETRRTGEARSREAQTQQEAARRRDRYTVIGLFIAAAAVMATIAVQVL